jgi:hypothetical protein
MIFLRESQNQRNKVFAVRWRLEPKSEDAQKQERRRLNL